MVGGAMVPRSEFILDEAPLSEIEQMVVDVETGGELCEVRACALLAVGAVALTRHDRPVRAVRLPNGDAVPGCQRVLIRWEPGLKVTQESLPFNRYDAPRWQVEGIPEALAMSVLTAWWRTLGSSELRWIAWGETFDREYLLQAAARRCLGDTVWPRSWRCARQRYRTWADCAGFVAESASLAAAAQRVGWWSSETEAQLHHDPLEDCLATAAVWHWCNRHLRASEVTCG